MKRTIGITLMTLMLLSLVSACRKKPDAGSRVAVAVRIQRPLLRKFQAALATQGVIEAVDHAVLAALIPGRIEEICVKEGDSFSKGTLLFRSERETLENRCTLAEEALKMARERVRTREADVNLAQVTFEKAKLDYDRSSTLLKSNAASRNAWEAAEVNFRKGKLGIEQATAALATAKAEVSFADATLRIARKHLKDAEVLAPYDGTVTEKLRNVREFCNAGTPVLAIESPGKKRIAFLLSAIHYDQVIPGQSRIELSFGGKVLCCVPVTIKGRAIDAVSRTFEVKGDLPENFALPSGTLCEVRVILEERENLSLPEDSFLFRKNGFSLFILQNDRAKEIPVHLGITQDGVTELLDAAALKETDCIVSGHYFLDDGVPVRVVR